MRRVTGAEWKQGQVAREGSKLQAGGAQLSQSRKRPNRVRGREAMEKGESKKQKVARAMATAWFTLAILASNGGGGGNGAWACGGGGINGCGGELPAQRSTCPIDTVKVAVCSPLLGGAVGPDCCPLLGLLGLDIEVCLCWAVDLDVLGLVGANVPKLDVVASIMTACGHPPPPSSFSCPPFVAADPLAP